MFAETVNIPFLVFKSQIVGHRVKLTLGPKTHWIQITPFVQKCLDRAMCGGCGLLISHINAYQVNITSTPRLAFWGVRRQSLVRFTQDHITPKVQGGSNDAEWNIEVLCRTCNLIKGDSLATRPALWMLKRHLLLREGVKNKMYNDIIQLGLELYGTRL